MNAPRSRRLEIVKVAAAFLVLLAACRAAPSPEADHAGCCAFDSQIDVAVVDADSLPVAGVPVALSVADGSATWPDSTGADGHAQFAPGILGTFLVSVAPPAGYALGPGQVEPDTVDVNQQALNPTVVIRLTRAAP